MDMRGQISITFLYRIEAGKSAEQRKVGRPDVGRDIYGPRAQLQKNLQQIMTVKAKYRPSVRMNISNSLKLM